MFSGCITALVTPFKGGKVHEEALRGLIRRQVRAGIHGLVLTGSTGEAPALRPEEKTRIWSIGVEEVGGKVPVLAGCGLSSTMATIEAAKEARRVGCDAALVVTPPYNKPPQRGLVEHFTAVAREGGLPVVLYHVPGRAAVGLEEESVAALAHTPGIVGLKDASGDDGRASRIARAVPEGFALLSGDDPTAVSWARDPGWHGVVSVTSNVVPRQMVGLWTSPGSGMPEADPFDPLHHALFLETNPMPVKGILAWLELMENELRLPLVPCKPETSSRLAEILGALGPHGG